MMQWIQLIVAFLIDVYYASGYIANHKLNRLNAFVKGVLFAVPGTYPEQRAILLILLPF